MGGSLPFDATPTDTNDDIDPKKPLVLAVSQIRDKIRIFKDLRSDLPVHPARDIYLALILDRWGELCAILAEKTPPNPLPKPELVMASNKSIGPA